MTKDFTFTIQQWRREAEILQIEDEQGLPNAFLAAKKFSRDGSTSTVIRSDGSCVRYRGGTKIAADGA